MPRFLARYGSCRPGLSGHSGAWLKDVMGEPWLSTLFTNAGDGDNADRLAECYGDGLVEVKFPLPSELVDVPDDVTASEYDASEFRAGFDAFLATWREKVLNEAEKRRSQRASVVGRAINLNDSEQ